jgi:hypothetical protein
MRALKGIQKRLVVRKDGTVVIYHYHRATGRRLQGDPSSAEYLAEHAAAESEVSALRDRKKTSLFHALEEFKSSKNFRSLPLRERSEFLSVMTWLPPEVTSRAIAKITVIRARRLRDKAALSRGTRFANRTLALLQSLMDHCIASGMLTANPAAAVPKLKPLHSTQNSRRMISSQRARGRLRDSRCGENYNEQGVIDRPES